jgi:hypothetical protein
VVNSAKKKDYPCVSTVIPTADKKETKQMSHYLSMKCALITDPVALASALTRMGIDRNAIEIHEKATTLVGYNGETRLAHVIVRKEWLQDHAKQVNLGGFNKTDPSRNTAYADIGFVKQEDGTYQALVDDHNFNAEWVKKTSTYYKVEKTKKELTHRKLKYTEALENGKPVLTAIIPSRTAQSNRLYDGQTTFG